MDSFLLTFPGAAFDQYMQDSPKRRKGSVKTLQRAFMEYAKSCPYILEIGANDGRQTKCFLEETEAEVHAFEPNPYLYKFLEDITHPRLRLNTFALGNEPKVCQSFYIPTNEVTGVSSLNVHSVYGYERVVGVSVQTASNYLRHAGIEGGIAAWIDVEGNADLVLQGFGKNIDAIQVALVEVETNDYYNRYPSYNAVIDILKHSQLEIVGRDWMNDGQFNLLLVRRGIPTSNVMASYSAMMDECLRLFQKSKG